MTAYISDFYTIDMVKNLLSYIIEVLNGDYLLGGGQIQSMYLANINIVKTKIYQDIEAWEEDNNITPDFVLPTSYFKVIVEAWKDYLLH